MQMIFLVGLQVFSCVEASQHNNAPSVARLAEYRQVRVHSVSLAVAVRQPVGFPETPLRPPTAHGLPRPVPAWSTCQKLWGSPQTTAAGVEAPCGRVGRGVGDDELLERPLVLVLDRLVEVVILVKVGTGLPDHATWRIALGYDEQPPYAPT